MTTHDNTVKLARAIQVGDALIAVNAQGERLCRVLDVTHEDGEIVVVHEYGSAQFKARDAVRIAHPDVVDRTPEPVGDGPEADGDDPGDAVGRPSVSVDGH